MKSDWIAHNTRQYDALQQL